MEPLLRSPPRSPAPKPSSASVSSPAFLTPLNLQPRKSPRSIGSTSTTRMEQSPLKVAASLIESLDFAHTEMMSFAADAAADAERARKNARTAHEIARRYQNRSYSSFKASTSIADSTAAKRPEMRWTHSLTPSRKNTNEEKEFQSDVDQERKENEKTGVITPVLSKPAKNLSAPQSPTPSYQRNRNRLPPSAPQSPTPYQRNKNRMTPQSPTSYERIAQHHADDLLQLSLELEKTKQELKSEQRLHKETQSSLELMKQKKIKAERGVHKIVQKYETELKDSTSQKSNLERALEVSRSRLQAAEEDAQLALDLAKDSAEQREKIEEWLLEARNEIEILKSDGKLQSPSLTTPKRSVHFADTDVTVTPTPAALLPEEKSSPLFYTPRENGPPRAMIAAGRQVLLRRSMTAQDAVIRFEVSPARSAERRQQLCQRLNKHLNNEDSSSEELALVPSQTPLSPTPGNTLSINNTFTKKKLEEYNTAMKILEISGKRIELDGYFWRDQSSKTIASNNNNPVQIDVVTRQYCQNVEVRILQYCSRLYWSRNCRCLF